MKDVAGTMESSLIAISKCKKESLLKCCFYVYCQFLFSTARFPNYSGCVCFSGSCNLLTDSVYKDMKLKHFRYVCPKLPLKGFIVEIVADGSSRFRVHTIQLCLWWLWFVISCLLNNVCYLPVFHKDWKMLQRPSLGAPWLSHRGLNICFLSDISSLLVALPSQASACDLSPHKEHTHLFL